MDPEISKKRPHLPHILDAFKETLCSPTSIAPLITFRILFGLVCTYSTIRFLLSGWIEKLFIDPIFFFKYYGFSWVEVPSEFGLYALHIGILIGAIGIALGCFYRFSIILFFLCFSYVELLDATNYLNHYYLVILLSFLLLFLPANRAFSIDTWRKPELEVGFIPTWCIYILIFQLTVVYFFAGIAKLNYDWLFRAMPMAIWLPERETFPILGYLFSLPETAFIFSWLGAFYDISIAFWLLLPKTRPFAYLAVLIFHILTKMLFNIGLFPLLMISSTLIFFSADFHKQLLSKFGYSSKSVKEYQHKPQFNFLLTGLLTTFVALQLLLPLRHYMLPGNVLWTEEGYRFSWRVMLVEKNGLATFFVEDPKTGKTAEVRNSKYLSSFQEKQMSIQPDFMIQYAHFLAHEYQIQYGMKQPIVRIESHVALNGRTSSQFIDPNINLAEIEDGFSSKKWILAPNF